MHTLCKSPAQYTIIIIIIIWLSYPTLQFCCGLKLANAVATKVMKLVKFILLSHMHMFATSGTTCQAAIMKSFLLAESHQ